MHSPEPSSEWMRNGARETTCSASQYELETLVVFWSELLARGAFSANRFLQLSLKSERTVRRRQVGREPGGRARHRPSLISLPGPLALRYLDDG